MITYLSGRAFEKTKIISLAYEAVILILAILLSILSFLDSLKFCYPCQ